MFICACSLPIGRSPTRQSLLRRDETVNRASLTIYLLVLARTKTNRQNWMDGWIICLTPPKTLAGEKTNTTRTLFLSIRRTIQHRHAALQIGCYNQQQGQHQLNSRSQRQTKLPRRPELNARLGHTDWPSSGHHDNGSRLPWRTAQCEQVFRPELRAR